MTKFLSPSFVAVAAFAGLAAGSPVPVSLPGSAQLSPANSPALDSGASRFVSPDGIMPDGSPDQMNQPSFNYEASFARRGLGLLGTGDVTQNVNSLGGGIGGDGLTSGATDGLTGAGAVTPGALPPLFTGALDTTGTDPNTAEATLNLCRLLGINCPKTGLTSTHLPHVKGGTHVGTTKGKGKGKGKKKGTKHTGGHTGNSGTKFSGGKNQINNKNHADGGNGTGGHGGTANGGAADCTSSGSLIGLNWNSCNTGNGGTANGGAGSGGRGGDTSSVLGRDIPQLSQAQPEGASGVPMPAAGTPAAPAPAAAEPAHHQVSAALVNSRGIHIEADDYKYEASEKRGTQLQAEDASIPVHAFAERDAEIVALKKQGESSPSLLARTLAKFRAGQDAPRLASRGVQAGAITSGKTIPAGAQGKVKHARDFKVSQADAQVDAITGRDFTVAEIKNSATSAHAPNAASAAAPAQAAAANQPQGVPAAAQPATAATSNAHKATNGVSGTTANKVSKGNNVPAASQGQLQHRALQVSDAEAEINTVDQRDLTLGQIKDSAASEQPATAAAPAGVNNQVPSQAQSASQAASMPAAAQPAAGTASNTHKGTKAISETATKGKSVPAGAQGQVQHARDFQLSGAHADVDAVNERDVTVAKITDAKAPKQATQGAPAQVPAQASPAGQSSIPAASNAPEGATTVPETAAKKGNAAKSTVASKAQPKTRSFSFTAIDASEDDTNNSEDAEDAEHSMTSTQPETRASITVLHNSDEDDSAVSSKRSFAVSGNQDGNSVSANFAGQGPEADDGSAADDEEADDTTDDSQDTGSAPTDDATTPIKRGNNKAGVSTGGARHGRVIVATAGNGGDAVSGDGGDASGFAFDNSRNGNVPAGGLYRPIRYLKSNKGSKTKGNGKGKAHHHFKVKKGSKGSKSSGHGSVSSKLSGAYSYTYNNPIVELDLDLLRQLIGADRLDQLASGQQLTNGELVSGTKKNFSSYRPYLPVPAGTGSGHIQNSGNGGDASSGAAIGGNGGSVNISQ
ncbi:hypothetical protein OC845_003275 [Tilletia horrida]|nr:hypothetical protein OC845_003275 [Tilletia horrida]